MNNGEGGIKDEGAKVGAVLENSGESESKAEDNDV